MHLSEWSHLDLHVKLNSLEVKYGNQKQQKPQGSTSPLFEDGLNLVTHKQQHRERKKN